MRVVCVVLMSCWRKAHRASGEDARGDVDDVLEEGDGAELVSEGKDLLHGRERTLPMVNVRFLCAPETYLSLTLLGHQPSVEF